MMKTKIAMEVIMIEINFWIVRRRNQLRVQTKPRLVYTDLRVLNLLMERKICLKMMKNEMMKKKKGILNERIFSYF